MTCSKVKIGLFSGKIIRVYPSAQVSFFLFLWISKGGFSSNSLIITYIEYKEEYTDIFVFFMLDTRVMDVLKKLKVAHFT
jgi:hypothetical protein